MDKMKKIAWDIFMVVGLLLFVMESVMSEINVFQNFCVSNKIFFVFFSSHRICFFYRMEGGAQVRIHEIIYTVNSSI